MKLFAYHNHLLAYPKNMLLDCVMAFDKWELFLLPLLPLLRQRILANCFSKLLALYTQFPALITCANIISLLSTSKCGFYFHPRLKRGESEKFSSKINTFNLISVAYCCSSSVILLFQMKRRVKCLAIIFIKNNLNQVFLLLFF